ncbi:MAG: hypothetical protein CM1200mP41_28310 [Gammaproteobacteria bacterium]|nr:MAG: hypothetical protein CM1200mP41_28310 [Gammaproteobacteria bacterium]
MRTANGLVPNWGDPVLIETLLFQTSEREGFGDTIADSAQAVQRVSIRGRRCAIAWPLKDYFNQIP